VVCSTLGKVAMGTGQRSPSSNVWIGFIVLLTVLLVCLRWMEEIDWSWWWVLAPIWLAAIFVVVVVALALIFMRD
jgi:hypothetical protein